MILISHRGNIDGRLEDLENDPAYVLKALSLGYDVEIDVWFVDNSFFLGHDFPQHKVEYLFLSNDKLWCHAKNIEALLQMKKYSQGIHYFWHEKDKVTLTSKNYVWAYPGEQPIPDSVAVMPEIFSENISQCLGVCSDHVCKYRNIL